MIGQATKTIDNELFIIELEKKREIGDFYTFTERDNIDELQYCWIIESLPEPVLDNRVRSKISRRIKCKKHVILKVSNNTIFLNMTSVFISNLSYY